MFLLYVLGVFAISLFGSQCAPETREQLFKCKSWGDPHIQTWHPRDGNQIQQQDCYIDGRHNLLRNPIVVLNVEVKSRYVIEVIGHFNDENTGVALVGFHLILPGPPRVDNNLRQAAVTFNSVTVANQTTTTITYKAARVSIVIHEKNKRVENIEISLPKRLAQNSTGLCTHKDAACNLRGVGTDESEWQPVRSGSTKQIFTNKQAETICNDHIDTYFAKIHRAPDERDAHVNSVVANVLAGCIEDVVLTGEIEAAEDGINVLMMDELTSGAGTVEEIEAAIQSGIEGASVLLNDAVKTANAKARKMF